VEEGLEVWFDKEKMDSILKNLLKNLLKRKKLLLLLKKLSKVNH
jgi:hypothetical protein